MKKNLFKISIGIGIAAAFASCTSMSTMQTARTTEEGKFGYSTSLGYINAEVAFTDSISKTYTAPILEAGVRYGITERLDAGGRLSIIGTSGVDLKYQFLGDKESIGAAAFGIGYGILSIPALDISMHDIMFPAYFSFHPLKWFSIYASPKYVLRIVNYSDITSSNVESRSSHWYGSTIGLRIGTKSAFLIEYAHFANSKVKNPFSQINMGVCVGF